MESLEQRLALTGAAPVAFNDIFDVPVDSPFQVMAPGILANDSDAEGDALTAGLFTGPSNGTLDLSLDGTFTYLPNPGFTGLDSFVYRASDGASDSALAAVTLQVKDVRTPLASNDQFEANEDESLVVAAGGILSNDTDPDGDPLSALLVSAPLHGTVALAGNGSFSYTPDANFNGLDGFSYQASDGGTSSEVATVTITVRPANDAPVAGNDEYVTDEDMALDVPVGSIFANDSDVDGDRLTAALVNGSLHGTLVLNGGGSFTYTPDVNYHGIDGFSYQVSDGIATSDIATVTITVNAVNHAPVGREDYYSVAEDGTLVTTVESGVLRNDRDADADLLQASLQSGPSHGSVTLNTDGSFNYSPEVDFYGSDTFSYLVSDGMDADEPVQVRITVNPVNDAPVAEDDEYQADSGAALSITLQDGVLSNDLDREGTFLSVALIDAPGHGDLLLHEDGSFTYTPGADFLGTDSFSYQAKDGEADSDVAVVTIHVGSPVPGNVAPVAAEDSYATTTDTAVEVAAPGVLANDMDVDALTSQLVDAAQYGTVTLAADGSFVYQPASGFVGIDTFTYRASDGRAESNVAQVSITIAPRTMGRNVLGVNDVFQVTSNTILEIPPAGVLANDWDGDGDALAAELFSGVQHGVLVLGANGSFQYTPASGYEGLDSFSYRATDGMHYSALTAVTLRVAASVPVAGREPSADLLGQETTTSGIPAAGDRLSMPIKDNRPSPAAWSKVTVRDFVNRLSLGDADADAEGGLLDLDPLALKVLDAIFSNLRADGVI